MVSTSVCNIIPKDVKIYYEDGIPYMEYRGIANGFNCDKFEVHFPKIKLEISEFSFEEEYYSPSKLNVTFSDENVRNLYKPTFKIFEKTMTKAQIEKELGYKVNIVEK